ncbi:hypothetical protein AX16_006551 [Volvariella volvacea WC 439]|nr:hypothetical protein AX16_006551 [Volvariella volvacea WC 439]
MGTSLGEDEYLYDPEDILSSSLQTLYEYQPITLTSAGSLFTYTAKHIVSLPSATPRNHGHQHIDSHPAPSITSEHRNHNVPKIELYTPDTHSANWSLHASAIWMASLFLADHIDRLGLPRLRSLSSFHSHPSRHLPRSSPSSRSRVTIPAVTAVSASNTERSNGTAAIASEHLQSQSDSSFFLANVESSVGGHSEDKKTLTESESIASRRTKANLIGLTTQTLADASPTTETSKPALNTNMDDLPRNAALYAETAGQASSPYPLPLPGVPHGEQPPRRTLRVLELGAAAGLPGILISKLYASPSTSDPNQGTSANGDADPTGRVLVEVDVTVSDYPDDQLIKTLSGNAKRNGVLGVNCRVVPYAWGTDASVLLLSETNRSLNRVDGTDTVTPRHGDRPRDGDDEGLLGFDLVIAADTLWNPSLHSLFAQTLSWVLRKSSEARVHLVAGLHTGRWTIQGFLNTVGTFGMVIESIKEYEVDSRMSDGCEGNSDSEEKEGRVREWNVEADDDEQERRRWVTWIILRWP